MKWDRRKRMTDFCLKRQTADEVGRHCAEAKRTQLDNNKTKRRPGERNRRREKKR